MTPFSTLVLVRTPVPQMIESLRDRLPEIARSLDDVDAIEELERAEAPGETRIVNRWRARQQVPSFLQERLGAAEISWIDRAVWSGGSDGCRWQIDPSIGDGAIQCRGATRFEPAMGGRGARIHFEGELSIDPAFVGGLVGPLQRPVTALVQSVASTLIPSNFRAAAEAAAKLG